MWDMWTEFSATSQGLRTNCNHSFHKSCLDKCVKIRPYCPTCNTRLLIDPPPTPSGVKTRSQGKHLTGTQIVHQTSGGVTESDVASGSGRDQTSLDPNSLSQMITSIVAVQQTQLFSDFSNQIAKLVRTNIEAGLSRLSIQHPTLPPVTTHAPTGTLHLLKCRHFLLLNNAPLGRC